MTNTIANKKTVKSNILSVFDFDGTLTRYDSFILFLYFAFGKYYFAEQLARKMLFPIFHYMFFKLTRDGLKEILIKTFLTDIDEYWLNQQANSFCEQYWKKLMRPAGIIAVTEELNSGAEVTICSASPTLVLQPWANRLGIKLIGTQLEVMNSKLTGRITGYNCRCEQKVARLEYIYGDLSQYHLRAWGDTRGDHELLMAAQDAHWRYFHPLSWTRRHFTPN